MVNMRTAVIEPIRLIPMFVIMGIIFFLSHQPRSSLLIPTFFGSDKVAHIAIYAVLAAAVLYAIQTKTEGRKSMLVSLSVVSICLLYGIGDEYHQSFIPGRFSSVADVAADTFGAVAACTAWFLWRRRCAEKTVLDNQY